MSSSAVPPSGLAPAPNAAPTSPLDGTADPAHAASPDDANPQHKPSVLDAAKTIRPLEDLQRLPNMPCARYSLLFGIVAGVSVGCLRFVFSRTARRGTLMGGGGDAGRWAEVGAAANWAVGAWGVGSLGAWETCRARQTAEAARMNALVSEIKARRAAKGPKPATAAADLERPSSGPAGIRIGALGEEVRRDQDPARGPGAGASELVVEPERKTGGGWFGGRI
ncbi:hypothetical protein JCM3775_000006 [Rhodotorula graminis]